MTINDLIQKLENYITEIKKGDVVKIAAIGTSAIMVERIFEKGLKSDGSKIGTYDSENEIYEYPNNLPRRQSPKGKPGAERNVKNRKTVYFKSYQDLRAKQGRESSFVNLRLTNDLQSDMANSGVSKSSDKIASPNPIMISPNEYQLRLRRKENVQKRIGLEKRYGTIFDLTKDEQKLFLNTVQKELLLKYSNA